MKKFSGMHILHKEAELQYLFCIVFLKCMCVSPILLVTYLQKMIGKSFKTEMEKELEMSAQEMEDKSVCGEYALKKYTYITQNDRNIKKVGKVLMLWTSGLCAGA